MTRVKQVQDQARTLMPERSIVRRAAGRAARRVLHRGDAAGTTVQAARQLSKECEP
ncbi:hypothetical protein BLAT2472_30403 [Burkholderia latens]